MSKQDQGVVKYPENFLSRPCDRRFLIELGDKTKGSLYAYRIWADFATGSSDRRPMSDPLDSEGKVARSEREVLIVEEFCDWAGSRGDLVRAAIDAGFLSVNDTGEGMELVCNDFYPLNSKATLSMQQKGAYAKIIKDANKLTDQTSASQLEIFERSQHEISKVELSADQKKEAIQLVQTICKIMHFKALTGSDWRGELVIKASDIINRYLVEERELAFRWLMVHRNDSDVPKRADLILKNFEGYISKGRTAS